MWLALESVIGLQQDFWIACYMVGSEIACYMAGSEIGCCEEKFVSGDYEGESEIEQLREIVVLLRVQVILGGRGLSGIPRPSDA